MKLKLLILTLIALLFPLLASYFSFPHISLTQLYYDATSSKIFWYLRVTRYLLAFWIGASLSVSGVSFQSLLKNPLADPYILGVSGGAALGYVVAVVLGLPFVFYPLFGLAFALLCLFGIYQLAREKGVLNTYTLLLTGIVFNSLSFALILLLNAMAPVQQAQQILFLLLGSLEALQWHKLALLIALTATGSLILLRKANILNILSLGENQAFHLGVAIEKEKIAIFILTSLLVGSSVSLCGLIGFVGLFVPHLMRLIFGADHRRLVPACFLGGGIFLVLSEYLASHLFSWDALNTKLPVGVITALIGAPLFFILLKRQSHT